MIVENRDRVERSRRKGSALALRWVILGVVVPVAVVGCRAPGDQAVGAAPGERVLLTVDFDPNEVLRYTFVSRRNIVLDWDPGAATSRNRVQEQSEELEMVVAYEPLIVDPYGISTIGATVESVEAKRSGGPGGRSFGTDAVESAQGESYVLKVDPRGRIVDSSQLETLVRELGTRAFRGDTSRGRIKEPDMIGDFWAGQWFLWDAAASIKRPAEGVTVGQTWRSQLSVPTPMVMRKARDVEYRLDEVRRSANGPLAVIGSTYTRADSVPSSWPVPYSGRFQMSGTFGFLGPYEVLGIEGTGEELFNVTAGRIEQQQQKYTMRVKASLPPMGIRASPHITIEQTLTMELMRPGTQGESE